MRFLAFGAILLALVLLAGCAQKPATNQTAPPPAQPPPVQPPPQVPPTPPVAPPPPPPSGNVSADDDMFKEDLGQALDDLDAVTDPADLQETSPNTFCDSNDDCWCRMFDGAKFLPGKAEWSCDMQANRCQKCVYR